MNMPDLTKCNGYDCPDKEKCYRFTVKPSKFSQSYFAEDPRREDGSCGYFKEVYTKGDIELLVQYLTNPPEPNEALKDGIKMYDNSGKNQING